MESGECVKTLQEHSECVFRLQALESGELISCSRDKTIKIWDLNEGSCIITLFGHTDEIKSIRIDNQTNILASCSEDKTIKIWNLKSGECVKTIRDNGGDMFDLIFI